MGLSLLALAQIAAFRERDIREARDFADVYVLARHFGKDLLLERDHALDAGFDPVVLAQMLNTLGRCAADEIPLTADDLDAAKAFFSAWAKELR